MEQGARGWWGASGGRGAKTSERGTDKKKRRETERGRGTRRWHEKSGKRERLERESPVCTERDLLSKSQPMKKQEELRG